MSTVLDICQAHDGEHNCAHDCHVTSSTTEYVIDKCPVIWLLSQQFVIPIYVIPHMFLSIKLQYWIVIKVTILLLVLATADPLKFK